MSPWLLLVLVAAMAAAFALVARVAIRSLRKFVRALWPH